MGASSLRCRLPGQAAGATLRLFDSTGRVVRTLDEPRLAPDGCVFSWDGRDGQGIQVEKGAYFARLFLGNRTTTERILVIR